MQLEQSYTVPELVEILGLTPGKVRRLFEEQILAAVKIDGVLRVPAEFLQNDEPLAALRGTLMVLSDGGLTNEEAVAWLLTENDQLDGESPISRLRRGHKSAVRAAALLIAL